MTTPTAAPTASDAPDAADSSPRPPAADLPSLSPSRAADFKTCPLLYRLRTIDRLPETPTLDQARGTLVHAVLERLFDLPAPERTPAAAAALVAPAWESLAEADPTLAELFDEEGPAEPDDTYEPSLNRLLASTGPLLDGYFAVEDPRRLEPAERESRIETVVPLPSPPPHHPENEDDGRLVLRGYLDRLDSASSGELRVVDYKSGGAPREAFEARALFQLKFYALVLWRARGQVPRVLRLLYLRDAEICDYHPEADELVRFERTLVALWRAIEQATAAREFRPKPSRLCDWCSYQALCPAYGGTPPPFPDTAAAAADPHPGP